MYLRTYLENTALSCGAPLSYLHVFFFNAGCI